MQKLTAYINQAVAVADLRNLAVENPVALRYQLNNGEVLIVVVSHIEPNNVTVPFNVLWIVANPDSPDFYKMLRRSSAEEHNGYRNTWSEIATLDSMMEELQYWDTSNGLSLGEVDAPGVGASTTMVRGFVSLNAVYLAEPSRPVVVEKDDGRMSDARPPAEHTHSLTPITMIKGAGGINEYAVVINALNDPKPGHILALLGPGAKPNEMNAIWRQPVASDLTYDGPMLTHLEIIGPVDAKLNEQTPFTFTCRAHFDNDTSELVSPEWLIVGNNQVATIGGNSGNFISVDVSEEQVVRVQASWRQPESGVRVSAFVDVTIEDATVYLELDRIEIVGPVQVNENSESVYSVVAYFDNATSGGVTPDTFTSSNPGAGSFKKSTGVLTVGELAASQDTVISATYTFRGETRAATLNVTCTDLTVYPESAIIVGPAEVEEGEVTAYLLRVTMTNGTKQDIVESDWASSNEQAGTIDGSGLFTAIDGLREDLRTTLSASYTLEGRTVYGSRQILVKDVSVYPASAVIVGPATVREDKTAQYQLQITFSDASTTIVSATDWAIDNPALGTIGAATGQLKAVEDVDVDVTGNITASFTQNEITVNATFPVTVTDETNYPLTARIIGAVTLDEGKTQTLQFEVSYQDATKAIVPVSNWASNKTSAATINPVSGIMTAVPNLLGDEVVIITASHFADGRTVEAQLQVTIRDATNYPVSAVISGPATIDEGGQADYTLAVRYADGTEGNRTAQWAITGGEGATVNSNGRVNAPANVDANAIAQLTASFTLDGVTVTASAKPITIIDTTVYPVSALILGPNQLVEGESKTYQLEVTFSNATRSVVPVTDWASTNPDVGIINASSGSFSALDVEGTKTTTISASYVSNGRTVGNTLLLSVLDTTNYPTGATIVGPLTVDEAGEATYQLKVTYTDGSDNLVVATDWTSSKTSVGVINPTTGAFTAATNLTQDGTTALRATYLSHGVTVEGNLTITVKDKTDYPVSAVVEGVAIVDSLGSTVFQLRVTFESMTSKVMPAVWTATNPAAGAIEEDGTYNALENVSGMNVTAVVKGSYTLDGREVSATKSIAVRDLTNYPASIAIVGASAVDSSDTVGAKTVQFVANVKYVDATMANGVTATWSVIGSSEADEIGTIDGTGLFTTNPKMTGATRSVTVRAEYVEHGRTVHITRALVITVVPFPSSLRIEGPARVGSETSTLYKAFMTNSSGVESEVASDFTSTVAVGVATLGSNGQLTTKRLNADETITIGATFSSNGSTVTANRSITIAKIVEIERIEVAGPTEFDSGTSGQYTVTAFYDNATQEDVTSSASYSVSVPEAGSFSAITLGMFTASNTAEDIATDLVFSFSANGATKSKTIAVNVIAPDVSGSAEPRFGVAMFADIDFTGGEGENIYGTPYTQWTGIQNFGDSVMTNLLPMEGGEFTFEIPEGTYGYVMYPASLVGGAGNRATFIDMGSMLTGGMGGVTWTPEGEIPEDVMDPTAFDGMDVTYDSGDGTGPQPWVIHRTDWDSLGTAKFSVSF